MHCGHEPLERGLGRLRVEDGRHRRGGLALRTRERGVVELVEDVGDVPEAMALAMLPDALGVLAALATLGETRELIGRPRREGRDAFREIIDGLRALVAIDREAGLDDGSEASRRAVGGEDHVTCGRALADEHRVEEGAEGPDVRARVGDLRCAAEAVGLDEGGRRLHGATLVGTRGEREDLDPARAALGGECEPHAPETQLAVHDAARMRGRERITDVERDLDRVRRRENAAIAKERRKAPLASPLPGLPERIHVQAAVRRDASAVSRIARQPSSESHVFSCWRSAEAPRIPAR